MSARWIEIDKSEIESWNEKLKNTDASFFQYPYYASGYKEFFLAKPVHIKLVDEQNNAKAFCTILQVGSWPFKTGLVVRGPVLLDEKFEIREIISLLKNYAKKKKYAFLRINPDDTNTEDVLKEDIQFIKKNYFPVYNASQKCDFNVYSMPEDALLASFQTMCRRKIKYAGQIDFVYEKIKTEDELKEVYELFTTLGKSKNFDYRPFKSYKEIFFEGNKYELCDVYTAKLNDKIVCAAFIVKDAHSYNYLSGALVVKGFNPKHSPANKVHYWAMQDCFYKENKHHYNISYSDPSSDVFVFKDSFHPKIEEKPEYYTYVLNKKSTDLLMWAQQKGVKKLKNLLRGATKIVKR